MLESSSYQREPDPKRGPMITPRFIFGIILIFVGTAFTLDQLDIVDADSVFDLWPALLIVAGLGKLLWPGSESSRTGGMVLTLVGSWMLLEHLGLIDVSFWDFWPIAVILLGLWVVSQGLPGRPRRIAQAEVNGTVNAFAMLGGSTRTSASEDFRGGDMIAIMGGCEIDLLDARIENGPAVIDAFAFWGGVEIKVPRDWEVIVKGVPILGGFEDATRQRRASENETHQQLIVKGFAIMGGVEVTN